MKFSVDVFLGASPSLPRGLFWELMVVWGGEGGHLFSLGKRSSLSFSLIRSWLAVAWGPTHSKYGRNVFLRGLPKLLLCQISLDIRLFFFSQKKKNLPLGGFEPPALLFILDLISDSLFSLSLSHFSALVYFHHQSNFVGWRPTAHNQPGVMLAPDGQLRKGVKK